MGQLIRNGKPYSGSSKSAETIKYDDTSNVKTAIDNLNNDLTDFKSSALTPTAGQYNNIDNLYFKSSVFSTDATTEGTFPEGFDKRGIVEVIIRTTARVYQRYTDIFGNFAVRYSTSSGVWNNWEIKAKQSDITAYPHTSVSLTTEEDIDNYYDTIGTNNFGPNTHYTRVVSHNVSHSVLGGGVWLLEGVIVSGNDEWQKITRYSKNIANGETIKYERSKVNGRWTAWVGTSYNDDITAIQTSVGKLKYEWTANIKCATWQRLCFVSRKISYDTSYLINVSFTRSNVVASNTYLVTGVGNGFGTIVKICGDDYNYASLEHSVRIVLDNVGNGYFEIYDAMKDATAETTQIVHCSLIPINTGSIATYTESTDGTTIPDEFAVAKEMTVTKTDFQSDVTDDLKEKAEQALYVVSFDASTGTLITKSADYTG